MSSNTLNPPPEIKVVVVGDGAVGKTCLCNVFVSRVFPEGYEPTIFENYTQKMTINGKV
jgi:small GTP-binding protein